jgi:hypothetical protein
MSVFAPNAVLWALNAPDPDERLERCSDLAELVESFDFELVFDLDRFVGVLDLMAPPTLTAAVA